MDKFHTAEADLLRYFRAISAEQQVMLIAIAYEMMLRFPKEVRPSPALRLVHSR